MIRKALRAAAIALSMSTVAFAPAALAHHSFAMYDFSKTVTLKGTIKDVLWANPHVIVRMNAQPAGGHPDAVWTLEMTSPGNLTRLGWTRNTLKAGMAVTITANPLRNGKAGGGLSTVTLPDGKTLSANLRDVETNAKKN